MAWIKKEQREIKKVVFDALKKNTNYAKEEILGIPASYLDSRVFSQDDRILEDAPFLSTLVQNPNHISCHTLGNSESFFKGTQAIEREVISICAEDILHAKPNSYDGYVASGGTEANIQAIWIYRNFYIQEKNAKHSEIAVICSSDSHYSMDKAANLLNIGIYKVETSDTDFSLSLEAINTQLSKAQKDGRKKFIVVVNMMTTMFGSIDDFQLYVEPFKAKKLDFKMHVDAAFGGFYYPFSNDKNQLTFANNHIDSFTLDAHKMAQSPYGTGVFLARKGLMRYSTTMEASYVEGADSTLIGSRSGANAVSIWMILSKYGPNGWVEKIFILQKRTSWLCGELDKLNVEYFRDLHSNIVTIKSFYLTKQLAEKYGLVPDNHHFPEWYKIVVMDHVEVEKIQPLLDEIKQLKTTSAL